MKTSFFILQCLLSILFIFPANCGHIYSQPSEIFPQNAQAAKTFHFYFMLETQISSNDCLFIKFPMLITTATALISTDMDPTVPATMTTTPGNDLSLNTGETRFFTLNQGLTANTWYRAVVTIGDASTQIAGVQGCVWFATTSSVGSTSAQTYITYDENRCFDVLAFAPTIDTTNFKVTGYYLFESAQTYKSFGGTYKANLDITPSQNVGWPGATFVFTIATPYTFTGNCSSISCVSNDGSVGDFCPSTGLAAIPSVFYNCMISPNAANVLTLVITRAVTTTTTRLQVGIQAPNQYIRTPLSISVQFQSSKAPIIFASTTVVAGSPNGLDLTTDFPLLSLTGIHRLMWGVVPSGVLAGRSSGYQGCPIVLYASGTNKEVFNSLQTSFTLTAAIKSMKANQGIKAFWTLLSGGLQLVDSLIMNSLYTTMPGTIKFAFDSTTNIVTITGIADLSVTTYSIGGKFSIDVSTDTKGAALSTIGTPTTPNVGEVSIKTGDLAKTFVSVSALAVSVKKNMEYFDTTVESDQLTLSNQVFSYWLDNSIYAWSTKTAGTATSQTDAATFNNYFFGRSATKGATAAVWPKPIGATGTQALLIQLVFDETAICFGSGTKYLGGLTLDADCALPNSPFTPQIGVLLKVVFNNGLLAIPDTSFIYGAQVIGSLFPGATPTTSFLQYSGSRTTTTGTLGNTIIKDSIGNFWHLSVSCIPISSGSALAVDLSCYSATAFSYSGGASDTFSGLAFINTNIAKYPSLYPDSSVLDFIICFKIAGHSTINIGTSTPAETAGSGAREAQWQLVEEGCDLATSVGSGACSVTAGPGLINGYVITGMVTNDVRTSVINGYLSSTVATSVNVETTTFAPYIPAYLRIGVTISSPVASASILGFFIGSTNVYAGLATYASSAGIINIIDTIGTATTATIGQGAPNAFQTALSDLWWTHDCLLINSSVLSGTSATFNFYVPIQISFTSIYSLNVALFGAFSKGQYPLVAVYRVFGSIVSNAILGVTPSYSTAGAAFYHTVSQILTANAGYTRDFVGDASGITFSFTYWDVGMTASTVTSTGCFSRSQTPSTSPQMGSNSGSILPSNTLTTGFYILSDVANPGGATCNIATGNQGSYTLSNSGRASLNTWGAAFIVYIRESTNIFASGILTWDYSNTFTNKCYFHTIGYNSKNIFTIFCTADFYSDAFGSGSKKLTITPFTVPFFWGQNYIIKSKINYAWSSNTGTIASFNGDPAVTSSWTWTGCTASDSLNLAANSNDVPITITLTSSNGVNFKLLAGDYLSLAISTSATFTFFSDCTHISLGCSITSTTISLTNNKGTLLSLPDSNIVINGWVDTGLIGSVTSYSIGISFKNNRNLIETCSSTANGGFQVSESALVNLVTIGSFSFMANQKARGVWSFSFSYPRIIRKGYDFSLNVGALAGPTTTRDVNNYRCLILQNKIVSNYWSTLTDISSLTYVSIVTSKTLLASGGTFTYKCIGGSSPDNSVPFTNLVSGTLERSPGGVKVTASTIPTANQSIVPTPSAAAATLTGVTLTKLFNTRGFESDYIFSFIPIAANITTNGRIVVEFSQSIIPKLNRYGNVDCFLNETPVFCKFSTGDERRVVIWPNMDLSTLQIDPYILRIASVTQPNSLSAIDIDSNKKIFFALSAAEDPYDGITEQNFVSESWDGSSNSSTIASIMIHDFSFQTSKIRSSTSFTYVLNFPANTFTTDNTTLWVQLPGSLSKSTFYGSSPTFTFVRVGDLTLTNMVRSSSASKPGRIAVNMKADAINTITCNYTLTIYGIATPQTSSQTGFVRDDFKIFIADLTNTTVLASTASGSRNTSTYISWNIGNFSTSQILYWYDSKGNQVNIVNVGVGLYQTLIFLSASMNVFTKTFTFAINNGNSSNFLTAPKDPNYPLRAVLGTNIAPVYIAAKNSTSPGFYYLSWSSTNTTGYSPIPNLDVRVINKKCTPKLSANSFDVPFGGTSDPIVVDFSNCIPMSDITITANVTSGFNMTSPLGISLSNQQAQSASLAFTNMNGIYRVSFYAVSKQGSNGTATSNVANISFTMSGTNGASIDSPGNVSINLVEASSTPPVPLVPTISGSVLNIGCDQSGTNFFAIATFAHAADYNQTYISLITENVNTPVTKPAENDPTYTFFGYVTGLTPPQPSSVNLTGYLKAGGNLTVYSFCQNNNYVAGVNGSSLNWLQPDNGGFTVSLKAIFTTPLSSANKVKLACALARNLTISSNRVLTDEGKWCSALRILQNTTTVNNQTSNSTAINGTQNTTYPAYFYILKDYLTANDNAASSVQSNILSASYLSNLISTAGDTTFPSLAYPYINSTLVNTSINNDGQTIIPSVNYSLVTSSSSINVTFLMTNMDGVVYAGIEPNVNTSSIPNATTLVQGFNGNDVALTAFNYGVTIQNVRVHVNFTNLTRNTQYLLYYVANNMDISYNGVFSAVESVEVSTGTPSGNFGVKIRVWFVVLGFLLLAMILIIN